MDMSLEAILKWVLAVIGGIASLIAIKRYLDEHPLSRPKNRTHFFHPRKVRSVKQYLGKELERLFQIRAPGSNLKMGDIIKDGGIFIDPLWIKHQGKNSPKKSINENTPGSLVNYVIKEIEKGERVLLLGEPGQGKSTLLQRVFTSLANKFIIGQSRLIPIYIPCRQLNLAGEDPISLNDILVSLTTDVNPLPLTQEDIKRTFRGQIVLIFDGLDEIGGTIKQSIIHQHTDSDIFLLPGITSCRTNFHQLYLSDLDNKLTRGIEKIELCPLDTPLVKIFVNTNCQVTGQKEIAENLIRSIEQNRDLSDLSRRFLSLVMMIDLYSNEPFEPDQSWNIIKLYDEYSHKWLTHEALKRKGLDWNQKSVIMEKIAWEIHTTKSPSTLAYGENRFLTISRVELENLLVELTRRFDLSIPELLSDVCYRTFLINEGENFQFIHRSFQEFYIAKFIYRSITQDIPAAILALQEFFPEEIASFLKDMVVSSNEIQIEQISDNLMQVYWLLQKNDSPSAWIALENTCYYLGRLKSVRIEKFLKDAIPREKREWIRRGMIIDMIYTYKKRGELGEYLKELRQNPNVDSVNLGYHLEYYGDQAPEGDHTDKMGIKCDRTIKAIIRHLRNPRKYEIGWALDIYTLRRILETRLKMIPAKNIIPESELGVLKEFLNGSHALDHDLEKEVRQFCRLLIKENIL